MNTIESNAVTKVHKSDVLVQLEICFDNLSCGQLFIFTYIFENVTNLLCAYFEVYVWTVWNLLRVFENKQKLNIIEQPVYAYCDALCCLHFH